MANDNAKQGKAQNLPTFGSKRFKQTIKSHKEVLDKFDSGFEEASKLKGDYKIFLDTNILLRIYSTSFKAREKLLKFLQDYRVRIVLSSQVQWEYVKNRENVINTFSNEVTKTIPNNFSNDILDNITDFQEKNKSKLIDYPEIQKKLEKLNTSAMLLHQDIEKAIGLKNVSTDEILYKDDFLKLLGEVELLEALPDDYIDTLKKEFDEFIKELEKVDYEKESHKSFPGCYEKKEKAEDPYGDYIIYHEMMNFAMSNSVDVIFLTYDVTKGDWMQKSKNPHLHYVENFYLNTGHLIYILNAQRTFEELLDINFKSLIKISSQINENVDPKNLLTFLDNYEPFANLNVGDTSSGSIINELLKNKYYTIDQIYKDVEKVVNLLPKIRSIYPRFNRIGVLRSCLYISNPSYSMSSVPATYFKPLNDLREELQK